MANNEHSSYSNLGNDSGVDYGPYLPKTEEEVEQAITKFVEARTGEDYGKLDKKASAEARVMYQSDYQLAQHAASLGRALMEGRISLENHKFRKAEIDDARGKK